MKIITLNLSLYRLFLSSLLLSSAALVAMEQERKAETSEEMVEFSQAQGSDFSDINEQNERSAVVNLLRSQLRGAQSLLRFGAGATRALLLGNGVELSLESSNLFDYTNIVDCFLNNSRAFNAAVKCLNRDAKQVLARHILHNHAFTNLFTRKILTKIQMAEFKIRCGTQQFGFLSTDGNYALVGCEQIFSLWDVNNSKRVWHLEPTERCVNFSLHNDIVLIQACQHLHILDLITAKQKLMISGAGINDVTKFDHNQNRIIAAARGTLKMWDMRNGKLVGNRSIGREGTAHDAIVLAKFNTTGDKICTIAASNQAPNGIAEIWDAHTLEPLCVLKNPVEFAAPLNVVVSFVADKILTVVDVGPANNFSVCDAKTGECLQILRELNVPHYGTLSPGGKKAITINYPAKNEKGKVKIWDLETQECVTGHHREHTSNYHRGCAAAFSKAEDMVVSISYDGVLRIWDAKTAACLAIRALTWSFDTVQFDDAGTRLLDCTAEYPVVYDIKRFKELFVWLNTQCSLEQALLIECIYQTVLITALLKKRNSTESVKFDFRLFPHLEEHYKSMPAEVQALLAPYVINTDPGLVAKISGFLFTLAENPG